MGFSVDTAVPVLTVFLQGLLSFFSPCVLPLVPLYIGYLSGGAKSVDEDGTIRYRRSTVLLNTLFFVLGISFTFVVLGLGFTAAGRFFSSYQNVFSIVGGFLVVAFGLYQLGVFGSSKSLSQEHRLPFRMDRLAMNPLTALLMGFVFSFAWTPCVGPALASVLLMASSAATAAKGFLLIGVYTLGFVLPFLALGFFTGSLLEFLKKRRNVVKYTVKVGGVLMILMGIMMITGLMNGFTSYLSRFGATVEGPSPSAAVSPVTSGSPAPSQAPSPAPTPAQDAQDAPALPPAPDFTLVDQNGETHTLSDYQGKTVFLNFWATWCNPCQREMPDIQALYEEYGGNEGDLIVLGVANPSTPEHPRNSDGSIEDVTAAITNGGYTYPTVMDTTGEVFAAYGIRSFPTTFMIDTEGNVFGYVSGAITAAQMESIVRQTMTGVRE